MLQAARYYLLTGDLEKAKSWGLNRAIFYAWAKHYGPSVQPYRRAWRTDKRLREIAEKPEKQETRRNKCPEGFSEVLGECVQINRNGFFEIGGQTQLPRDFDREIAGKVSKVIDWEMAWKAALDYVRSFPEWVLRDPNRFYQFVYLPVRDTFFKLLLEGRKPAPPPNIAKRLESLHKVYGGRGRDRSIIDYIGGS